MRAVFTLIGNYKKDDIWLIWIKEKDFNDIKKIDSNMVFYEWENGVKIYYLLNEIKNYKENTMLLELVQTDQVPQSATRYLLYNRENFIELNTDRKDE